MKKTLIGALAAVTAGSALAAVVAPASAEPYRGYHDYHRGGGSGAAIAAGIAGLAIGAALASDHDRGYGPPPVYAYGPRYEAPVYYSSWRSCHTEWRWAGRWRGYERVRVCW